ncbi:hypothetical protein [Mucilaginibacter sp. MD40]|uniref:hypothetical protein n=1 Tax=Mucilaginibacter sp. MD40 TaxID=2029590 RepID=UPI00117DFC09|nr:hypothetical protein [Mucilaginibacter sp. MD40]
MSTAISEKEITTPLKIARKPPMARSASHQKKFASSGNGAFTKPVIETEHALMPENARVKNANSFCLPEIFAITIHYSQRSWCIKVLKITYRDQSCLYKVMLPDQCCMYWLMPSPQGWRLILGEVMDEKLLAVITSGIESAKCSFYKTSS